MVEKERGKPVQYRLHGKAVEPNGLETASDGRNSTWSKWLRCSILCTFFTNKKETK